MQQNCLSSLGSRIGTFNCECCGVGVLCMCGSSLLGLSCPVATWRHRRARNLASRLVLCCCLLQLRSLSHPFSHPPSLQPSRLSPARVCLAGCAPEVLLGQLATEKADIFSLGGEQSKTIVLCCTLYCQHCGTPCSSKPQTCSTVSHSRCCADALPNAGRAAALTALVPCFCQNEASQVLKLPVHPFERSPDPPRAQC